MSLENSRQQLSSEERLRRCGLSEVKKSGLSAHLTKEDMTWLLEERDVQLAQATVLGTDKTVLIGSSIGGRLVGEAEHVTREKERVADSQFLRNVANIVTDKNSMNKSSSPHTPHEIYYPKSSREKNPAGRTDKVTVYVAEIKDSDKPTYIRVAASKGPESDEMVRSFLGIKKPNHKK